jgi:hypothetical protein
MDEKWANFNWRHDTQHNDSQHSDITHNGTLHTIPGLHNTVMQSESVIMLSVLYAECRK